VYDSITTVKEIVVRIRKASQRDGNINCTKFAMLLIVTLALAPVIADAMIVYDVNQSGGPFTVTGTITTDGNTGPLTSADIIGSNLYVTGPIYLAPVNVSNGWTMTGGDALSATSTQLDFLTTPAGSLTFSNSSAEWGYFGSGYNDDNCFRHEDPLTAFVCYNQNSKSLSESVTYPLTGTSTTIATAAPVPLPAAAWLMLSGLCGLGALAGRRKRAAWTSAIR